jgi:uncharacterized protein (TIGR02145 family)
LEIYKYILLYFLILSVGANTYAQKVRNISFRQEQNTIVVSYELETKSTCKIDLFISTNSGISWLGPLKKVEGDVGNKITSGSNSITWNVLDEYKELRGDKIKFQVRAKIDYIETVNIEDQEWTTKNLNVSRYRNGDVIPEVKDPIKWKNLKTGAWCYFNNDPKNGAIYGKLYNWYAVNDSRGLAPEGFHIPTKNELYYMIEKQDTLSNGSFKKINYLDSIFNYSKKKFGHGRTNKFITDYYLKYWSASEDDERIGRAHILYLVFDYRFFLAYPEKFYGYYVRCIKD